ncbi:MAG: tetratricopeptide repeat protein [Gammaproteobacteria bacterium]|nr:tetratricopeptide repeat protein [Gammaproteobacteria bacterium]
MISRLAASALLFAATTFQPLNAGITIDPEQMFTEAMQLRQSGQLTGAIELFETILSKSPDLDRARLELAVSYHQARRYEDAKQQLKKVLDNPDTPDTVKLSVTAYLAQLSSDEKSALKRTSSSIYLSAGIFTDSNTNLGPSNEVVRIANLTPDSAETSGSGSIIMASFSHRSRASKPFTVFDSLTDMEWHSQATAYSKMYTGDESDFNLSVIGLSTGPALIASGHWRALLNIKIDQIYFSGNPYGFNLSLNPSLTLVLDKDLEISFEHSITAKELSRSEDKQLTGTDSLYGIEASKSFNNFQLGILGGLRHHSNGAKANDLQSSGLELYLGAQMAITQTARLYCQISSRDYDYDAASTGYIIARDETEQQALLGMSHDLKDGPLKSWTLNGQYTYIKNKSNIDAFEYNRNILEVNLRRYF